MLLPMNFLITASAVADINAAVSVSLFTGFFWYSCCCCCSRPCNLWLPFCFWYLAVCVVTRYTSCILCSCRCSYCFWRPWSPCCGCCVSAVTSVPSSTLLLPVFPRILASLLLLVSLLLLMFLLLLASMFLLASLLLQAHLLLACNMPAIATGPARGPCCST